MNSAVGLVSLHYQRGQAHMTLAQDEAPQQPRRRISDVLSMVKTTDLDARQRQVRESIYLARRELNVLMQENSITQSDLDEIELELATEQDVNV